ncbi:hypothetical protein TNCV_4048991 [Trichonephila clavipes]|nr:hypothetical protein TNCV_4048991 [Trichonephila clavipes]
MDWPANSPDLLHPPENTQQLKQILIEEWALLPQEILHQLVLSMSRRCEATVADRVVVYSASTPQVWGSLNGLRKVDSAFHPRYIGSINEYQACFGDEAHFWLNGYVNKQNCRIWSEANPQVYAETPLHPEKLTVWCALWAGGILLQKR